MLKLVKNVPAGGHNGVILRVALVADDQGGWPTYWLGGWLRSERTWAKEGRRTHAYLGCYGHGLGLKPGNTLNKLSILAKTLWLQRRPYNTLTLKKLVIRFLAHCTLASFRLRGMDNSKECTLQEKSGWTHKWSIHNKVVNIRDYEEGQSMPTEVRWNSQHAIQYNATTPEGRSETSLLPTPKTTVPKYPFSVGSLHESHSLILKTQILRFEPRCNSQIRSKTVIKKLQELYMKRNKSSHITKCQVRVKRCTHHWRLWYRWIASSSGVDEFPKTELWRGRKWWRRTARSKPVSREYWR